MTYPAPCKKWIMVSDLRLFMKMIGFSGFAASFSFFFFLFLSDSGDLAIRSNMSRCNLPLRHSLGATM